MFDLAHTESPRKRLSALAQLVRILMRNGITSSAELAQHTQFSERQIWRAKAELRVSDSSVTLTEVSVTTVSVPTDGSVSATLTEVTPDPDRSVRCQKERVSPHTPLPKETPPAAACKPSEKPEIEGLNGSTPKLVSQFAALLAGPLGTPDEETAYDLLESNVELYGAEKVKIGLHEFRQKMAAEKRVANPLGLFNGFVKGAKLPSATKPKEDQYDRMARESGGRFVTLSDGRVKFEFVEGSA